MLLQEAGEQSPLPLTLPLKQQLLRALMNVRLSLQPSKELLRAQDAELQQQRLDKGVVEIKGEGLHLWRGDITRLKVDAIVNAANSALLGCFIPLHNCIDNTIHSTAGIQLRRARNALMQTQQHKKSTRKAKLTLGFNLQHAPSRTGQQHRDYHPISY